MRAIAINEEKMNFFNNSIADLRDYLQRKKSDRNRKYPIPQLSGWSFADKGSVVLGPDKAI